MWLLIHSTAQNEINWTCDGISINLNAQMSLCAVSQSITLTHLCSDLLQSNYSIYTLIALSFSVRKLILQMQTNSSNCRRASLHCVRNESFCWSFFGIGNTSIYGTITHTKRTRRTCASNLLKLPWPRCILSSAFSIVRANLYRTIISIPSLPTLCNVRRRRRSKSLKHELTSSAYSCIICTAHRRIHVRKCMRYTFLEN